MEFIEMAKKNPTPKEPTISNIPIPASDSPMVIDLPDGQKIVLGKLTPGAVIEVATWRGTGRPDSRTNRFMLGISDSSAPQTPQGASEQGQAQSGKKFNPPWKSEKMKKTDQTPETSSFITRFVGGTIASFSKALKRTQDLAPVETTTDLEINAWLENLSREVKEEAKPSVPRKAAAKKAPAKKKAAKPAKKKSK
jgi:hypothetical protein